MYFNKAIYGFVIHLTSNGYSTVTIAGYKRTLDRFLRFIGDRPVDEITTQHITDFFTFLRQTCSESSIQYHWKVLRSFFAFICAELGIPRPDINIPQPKFISRTIQPYTQEEIAALLKHASSKRNRALILTLLDTGLRVSELCRLRISDVNLETGFVTVKPYQTSRKSRPRIVILGNTAKKHLWHYIAARPDGDDPTAPLFATHRGTPLDRTQVKNILLRIAKKAGVPHVHAHRFRHTFAIQYLRNGGDIFTLQRLLGHASLQMVRHYLALADTDLETAHRRASPADRWKL